MALIKFPGLIDIHVHLRDPGATQKEDFLTGSRAALKGGFTYILDMPNNPGMPTISLERLQEKIMLSEEKAVCDIGFHYGTDGKNMETFGNVIANPHVFGLKIYCNHTTGDLLVDEEQTLDSIFRWWESLKPILVHAENEKLDICLSLAKKYQRRLHVCHIAEIADVVRVRKAKEAGLQVTAGVTPHHLFLKEGDCVKLGPLAMVKPAIGDEQTRLALWEALKNGSIDVIESDHAPHTKNDKMRGTQSFGVPGLETTIGLLMHSFVDGMLTLEDIIALVHDRPKKIFHIPDQSDTFIQLDPQKPYIVGSDGYETKCGWSPYDGWELTGKVEQVVLRGKPLMEHGKIIAG